MEQAGTEDGEEDEADVEMVGGARTPLSPAVQRTVAAVIIRLASRAQYSKVCSYWEPLLTYSCSLHSDSCMICCLSVVWRVCVPSQAPPLTWPLCVGLRRTTF